MPMALRVLFHTLLALCPLAAASGTGTKFLGSVRGHHGFVGRQGSADLLAELERLGEVSEINHTLVTNARVDRLEEALLPLFRIAPKDANGHVDAKAARYALHRLFVQRHAWHVNGIELHGAVHKTSQVGKALVDGGSFSLRQLAHFAATLETLVHVENIDRLQRVFDALALTKLSSRSDAEAKMVVEGYMAFYLSTRLPANTSVHRALRTVAREYPQWAETQVFIEEIRKTIFERTEVGEAPSLWDSCLQVVEEIGERYGRWQNKDCMELKGALMEMETPGTGRVPLGSFWGGVLTKSSWMFDESLPFLEQLGALEGSQAPHHSVLIPNYVLSSANCLAGSKYYDVCCLNECETLLGELESQVAAFAAPPQRLRELVEALPSSSVAAPRELPGALAERLEDIAAHHGGLVPLHGRLFQQFLHHAYPRECVYPRLSVSNASERSDQTIQRLTKDATVTKDAVFAYVTASGEIDNAASAPASSDLPWNHEEDLFMLSELSEYAAPDVKRGSHMPHLGCFLGVCAATVALTFSGKGRGSQFSEHGQFV